MKSDEWLARAVGVKYAASFRCEWPGCRCSENIQVHHFTYDRLGNEAAEDLICLCDDHHLVAEEERRSGLVRSYRQWLEARVPDIDSKLIVTVKHRLGDSAGEQAIRDACRAATRRLRMSMSPLVRTMVDGLLLSRDPRIAALANVWNAMRRGSA